MRSKLLKRNPEWEAVPGKVVLKEDPDKVDLMVDPDKVDLKEDPDKVDPVETGCTENETIMILHTTLPLRSE